MPCNSEDLPVSKRDIVSPAVTSLVTLLPCLLERGVMDSLDFRGFRTRITGRMVYPPWGWFNRKLLDSSRQFRFMKNLWEVVVRVASCFWGGVHGMVSTNSERLWTLPILSLCWLDCWCLLGASRRKTFLERSLFLSFCMELMEAGGVVQG